MKSENLNETEQKPEGVQKNESAPKEKRAKRPRKVIKAEPILEEPKQTEIFSSESDVQEKPSVSKEEQPTEVEIQKQNENDTVKTQQPQQVQHLTE